MTANGASRPDHFSETMSALLGTRARRAARRPGPRLRDRLRAILPAGARGEDR